jgi:hypothetical protein
VEALFFRNWSPGDGSWPTHPPANVSCCSVSGSIFGSDKEKKGEGGEEGDLEQENTHVLSCPVNFLVEDCCDIVIGRLSQSVISIFLLSKVVMMS